MDELDRLDLQKHSATIRALRTLDRYSMSWFLAAVYPPFGRSQRISLYQKETRHRPIRAPDVLQKNRGKVPTQQDLKQILPTQLIHSL